MPEINIYLLAFVIIGCFWLVSSLIYKKLTAEQTIITLFIIMMLAISVSYLIGVDGTRTMRQYYNAYPLLALIPAVGIFAITRWVKMHHQAIDILIILIIAICSFTPTFSQLKNLADTGMATPERWEMIKFVRDFTPSDAKVFFLLGFEHEIEMLSERIVYKGDLGLGFTQKNLELLCQQTMPENFLGQWGAAFSARTTENNTLEYPERQGVFSFPFRTLYRPGTTTPIKNNVNDEVPLNTFDYVVLQYAGTQLDQCAIIFINKTLTSNQTKTVWNNGQFIILEVVKQ
jgi:hypothetical protein